MFRAISLHLHGALEVVAAPLLLAAPFVFGFGGLAAAASMALGALLLGLALSLYNERSSVTLSAHVGFDYAIALATVAAGVAIGIFVGNAPAAAFLVGFGALHMALTASTRFSRPLGA